MRCFKVVCGKRNDAWKTMECLAKFLEDSGLQFCGEDEAETSWLIKKMNNTGRELVNTDSFFVLKESSPVGEPLH